MTSQQLELASYACWQKVHTAEIDSTAPYYDTASATNTYCVEHVIFYVVALFNSCFFLTFLYFNWKAQVNNKWYEGFTKSTNLILLFTFASQFILFFDYFLKPGSSVVKIIMIVVLEFIKFNIFFYICYFFAKKATDLLPHRERWLKGLKIFFAIAFIIFSILLGFYTWSQTCSPTNDWCFRNNNNVNYLCTSEIFILLSTPNVVFTLIFILLAVQISKKADKITYSTKYEQEILQAQHARAVRNLQRCAIVFFTCSFYLLIYNIVLYRTHNNTCGFKWVGNAGNNFFWIFSRSVQYIIWVIPIYALFWPSTNPVLTKIRRLLRIDEHSHDKNVNLQSGDDEEDLSDNDAKTDDNSDLDQFDYGATNQYFGGATQPFITTTQKQNNVASTEQSRGSLDLSQTNDFNESRFAATSTNTVNQFHDSSPLEASRNSTINEFGHGSDSSD